MKFKRIYIEISNICNLKCTFCKKSNREKNIMSVENFRKYATQAREYTEYIYLHILGEPLLHPNFSEILGICEKLGFKVNLTTNATLLTKMSDTIINSKAMRQVNISLHGYTEKTHGNLEMWLTQLVDFAKKFAEKGGYTVFRFWTMGKNNEVYDTDMKSMKLLQKITNSQKDIFELRKHHSITLMDNVFVSFDKEFKWPSIYDEFIGTVGKCHGAKDMIGILCDGSVVPCCLDGEGECRLGNLNQNTLTEILNTERYQNMYNSFLKGRITEELCQKCTFRLRFTKNSLL